MTRRKEAANRTVSRAPDRVIPIVGDLDVATVADFRVRALSMLDSDWQPRSPSGSRSGRSAAGTILQRMVSRVSRSSRPARSSATTPWLRRAWCGVRVPTAG